MHSSSPPADAVPEYLLRATAAGTWVISDRHGLEGGTFRSREAAIRFVRHTSLKPQPRIAIVASGGREPAAA